MLHVHMLFCHEYMIFMQLDLQVICWGVLYLFTEIEIAIFFKKSKQNRNCDLA